jgi:hypothetical protein
VIALTAREGRPVTVDLGFPNGNVLLGLLAEVPREPHPMRVFSPVSGSSATKNVYPDIADIAPPFQVQAMTL